MAQELVELHQKVDHLTQQMESLTSFVSAQQQRQQALDELKDDLIPIGNQMMLLAVDELAEIDSEFELEDLFYLLKRVLRNTTLILRMMDRVEALMGLLDEAELLGKQVFTTSIESLDHLEQEGYFELLRAIGDQLKPLLETAQKWSDPQLLEKLNQLADVLQESDLDQKSDTVWGLLKKLRKPEVRSGLTRMINLVEVIG